MAEKIKSWLTKNKKDIKIIIIGGIILSVYILFFQFIGEQTDFGFIEAFFWGMLLTFIFMNVYRLLWRPLWSRLFKGVFK